MIPLTVLGVLQNNSEVDYIHNQYHTPSAVFIWLWSVIFHESFKRRINEFEYIWQISSLSTEEEVANCEFRIDKHSEQINSKVARADYNVFWSLQFFTMIA